MCVEQGDYTFLILNKCPLYLVYGHICLPDHICIKLVNLKPECPRNYLRVTDIFFFFYKLCLHI